MKKILITGAHSYIGTSLEKWLNQWTDQYKLDTMDMRDPTWRDNTFSEYDCVFHVAGIAHVDTHKASETTKELYYKINRDLTIETARKAKDNGVKQFIFMSSIIVYGDGSHPLTHKKYISRDTVPNPTGFYGDSKLQGEQGILTLQSEDFQVVILRPPMIYGFGSKGNYPKLSKLACKIPIFPDVYNERSMLYIEHLCEFIRLMIDNKEGGIFFPQNDQYTCTSKMVKMIANVHGKHMKLTKLLNPFIRFFPKAIMGKVFGTLAYDKSISTYKENYNIYSFEETIRLTEENSKRM